MHGVRFGAHGGGLGGARLSPGSGPCFGASRTAAQGMHSPDDGRSQQWHLRLRRVHARRPSANVGHRASAAPRAAHRSVASTPSRLVRLSTSAIAAGADHVQQSSPSKRRLALDALALVRLVHATSHHHHHCEHNIQEVEAHGLCEMHLVVLKRVVEVQNGQHVKACIPQERAAIHPDFADQGHSPHHQGGDEHACAQNRRDAHLTHAGEERGDSCSHVRGAIGQREKGQACNVGVDAPDLHNGVQCGAEEHIRRVAEHVDEEEAPQRDEHPAQPFGALHRALLCHQVVDVPASIALDVLTCRLGAIEPALHADRARARIGCESEQVPAERRPAKRRGLSVGGERATYSV
mmetsp:Transcript_1257/g.3690  ORF Transcript_1257/g.3690 Transcript_1257/m.3690 type:complete len:350 (-) Transcript_1257:66-1115(-)